PNAWNIQKSFGSVILDSTSVMVKAAEIASIYRVACITHCLHNSVVGALESAKRLGGLVDKCHELAKFFHCSPKMASVLEDQQSQVDSSVDAVAIITDVVTRRNSTNAIEVTVQVLKLIEDITLVFSSASKGLAASLYPWIASIRDELVTHTVKLDEVAKFQQELTHELKKQFQLTNLIQTSS
ncbi:hypothetical protein BGZ95_007058, partial [Linnemannia exigua]